MDRKSDKWTEKATNGQKKRQMDRKIDNGKKIFKNRKMFTDLNEI